MIDDWQQQTDIHLHSDWKDYLTSETVHPNNNKLSGLYQGPKGALINQILRGILVLNVVHFKINFDLLSGFECGEAWNLRLISSIRYDKSSRKTHPCMDNLRI